MNIRNRLIILNFLEFFIWGSWLLSIGTYMSNTLNFSSVQVGLIFSSMGIISLFMPAVAGVIADKWLSANKVLAFCLLISSFLFIFLIRASNFDTFYWLMFLILIFYMPTLSINNAISLHILEQNGMDSIKHFPSIRVWGTVGFILSSWCVDFLGLKHSPNQFYIAMLASALLALHSLSLLKIKAQRTSKTWLQHLGIDAFVLFKKRSASAFLVFSMLVGTILQITNIWGVPFLDDFKPDYPDSFVAEHSVFLMSFSQISEVFFIITIPFFMSRFGIKKVVLISMLAWTLRFLLFATGSPEGFGLLSLILSMIVYGAAFDFFFVSGSLYMDKISTKEARASTQGLFMVMTSGFGWMFGGYGSGYVVDLFTKDGLKDWGSIWLSFSGYALVISIAFYFLFRHKHVSN